ncbi:hypothetical protein A2U01_0104515, partial [Trifolium medium]|nr:hypothetical protein [Trifolium medium]
GSAMSPSADVLQSGQDFTEACQKRIA